MSPRTLRILAIVVVVLFAAVWLVNRQRDAEPAANALLLAGLEDRLGELTAVTLTDADGSTRIERRDDEWVVPAKGGYRADTAKLRGLLLGLAEAHKIEQKTANPELYDRIGVQDPTRKGEDESAEDTAGEDKPGEAGVLVASEGLGDADFAVILGDAAQRDYRYVRIADEATSWLIDRNPDVPDAATGWLVPDLTDLAASSIRSVTIRHEDGETIRIAKESEDADNFSVMDIPEGRELSYPSVANSIAAALDNLSLDDVRKAGSATADGRRPGSQAGASPDDTAGANEGGGEGGADEDSLKAAPEAVTTVYRTFDGLEVTVESTGTDDETWIRLHAAALPAPEGTTAAGANAATDAKASTASAPDRDAGETGTPAADEAPDGAATGSAAGAPGTDAATDGDTGDGEAPDSAGAAAADEAEEAKTEAPDPAALAAEINARVAGWEYRIPEYKASQLRRHWEDLLRAPPDDEEE